MEENKTKNAIDSFTVLYCVLSVLVVLIVLVAFGGTVLLWYEWLLVIAAPFILDALINMVLKVYEYLRKVLLNIKKWIYDKRNPPKRF